MLRARAAQLARQGCLNAHASVQQLDEHTSLDRQAAQQLRQAVVRLGWSARAYHRVLKVARTIADLADARDIGCDHVREAIQYRRLALPE